MCTKDVACAFSAELGENQRQHIPAPDNLAHSRCLTGGADIIDNKADDAIWLKNFLFHVALWIGAHQGICKHVHLFPEQSSHSTMAWPMGQRKTAKSPTRSEKGRKSRQLRI